MTGTGKSLRKTPIYLRLPASFVFKFENIFLGFDFHLLFGPKAKPEAPEIPIFVTLIL